MRPVAAYWRYALCLGAASMFLMLAGRTQAWVRAEWLAAYHRDEVELWATGAKPWGLPEWAEAEADVKQANRILPDDPSLHELLGTLYSLRGAKAWFDLGQRQAWFKMAEAEQMVVVKLRPTVPQGWANLAMTRYLNAQAMDEVAAAWRESVRQGPYERNTKRLLLNVVLGRWVDSPADMKAWARGLRNKPDIVINLDSWVVYYRINDF
jgi:tetratricopeptide (TPR) repeat protein